MSIPDVRRGWVRIRVTAFGVNESEVTSRRGKSGSDISFPRILGIEAVASAVKKMMSWMGDQQPICPTADVSWAINGRLPAVAA
jgi:NADPH:quinone reductase-like Zn-dependent oxidoreductase